MIWPPAKATVPPAPKTLLSAIGHHRPIREVKTSNATAGPASTSTSRRIGGTVLAARWLVTAALSPVAAAPSSAGAAPSPVTDASSLVTAPPSAPAQALLAAGWSVVPRSDRGPLLRERGRPGDAADLSGVGRQHRVPGLDQPLLCHRHPAGRQQVQVAGADAAVLDQPGITEHPQVLAHRRTAHRQALRELPHRSGPVMQQFQDAAAHRL